MRRRRLAQEAKPKEVQKSPEKLEYKCEKCGRTFQSGHGLKIHMAKAHPGGAHDDHP
jgi:transposase-like protein